MQGVTRTIKNGYTKVTVSAAVTQAWADGEITGAKWPCSSLAGKRVRAEFDCDGNLVDLIINGKYRANGTGAELDALLEDVIGTANPACPHTRYLRIRNEYGIMVRQCKSCGSLL